MADRSHLSIGEVLSLLRDEFPDVTISKIRFLESQGLVDPERTPSGYRKFYDHDVERLRWILRQQREHFLPLKVIRGRLSEQEGETALTEPVSVAAAAPAPGVGQAVQARPVQAQPVHAQPVHDGAAPQPTGAQPGWRRPDAGAAPAAGRDHTGAGGPAGEAPSRLPGSLPAGAQGDAQAIFQALAAAVAPAITAQEPPVSAPAAAPPAPPTGSALEGVSGGEPETYTAEELAEAAGAARALVSELDQYGLISARAVVAGVPYFDESSLAVARAAAAFARHGVEVRHLKVWRNAAEREADLFQQVVLPLLRQRNPQARRQAAETLDALAAAGGELRAALVERAVRDIH